MIIRVIRGSIKHNDNKYGIGETLELGEENAKAIIRTGIAEEVQEDAPKPKKEEKPEKEKVEKELKAVETKLPENSAEPSTDWTRKELDEFARGKGIAEPEKFGNKDEVLEAILKTGGESK